MVDVAYLSSGLEAGNRLPASYAFTSTFAGGLAQLRLPLRFAESYAGLAAGYVAVNRLRSLKTQCGFGSGFDMPLLFALGSTLDYRW
jgi:hypothetical protein